MKWWCFFCIFLASLQEKVQGSNILVVFPMTAHSHYILGRTLVDKLLERGHQVTFISPEPSKGPIKNLTEITLSAEASSQIKDIKEELFEMGKMSALGQLEWVTKMGYMFTESVFSDKKIQSFMKSGQKFDLVLVEQFVNEALMVFGHVFKCPLVLLAPGPVSFLNRHFFANPLQPSFMPNLLSGLTSKMNLWQRMLNSYHELTQNLYRERVILPTHNAIIQKYLPGAPDIKDLIYNASLMLTLSDTSIYDTIPLVPAIKEIGGYHVKPPKPLPAELKKFLDNSKEGVVIFSMGSNLKSSDFSSDKKQAILNAFSKIPQKVIWKFEAELPNLPDNVKIMKWLPQQDILAHPNVKLFITHGGLLGTIEAVYSGVPLLGLPVFWDQTLNIDLAVQAGYALKLPFTQLKEESFSWALNEILNHPKYENSARTRSGILHDQLVPPIDRAMFWLEYVIRHQGALHLQTAGSKLPWYQLYSLDIIIVLTTITIILFAIFYWIFKNILKVFSSKPKKVKKN